MAFNLEEWIKLSEAERERRYERRLRDEEQGKNIVAFLAFILICTLLIYVFTGSRRPAISPTPRQSKPSAHSMRRHYLPPVCAECGAVRGVRAAQEMAGFLVEPGRFQTICAPGRVGRQGSVVGRFWRKVHRENINGATVEREAFNGKAIALRRSAITTKGPLDRNLEIHLAIKHELCLRY